MELALIDGIGPFFRGLDQRRINWSKIPFGHLATSGEGRAAQWTGIRADFETLAGKVAALGYNAVTLDDLAHLADHPWFEPALRERNAVLREEFRQLFAIARAHGLRVFITTDYLTTSAAVDARLRGRAPASRAWFRELVDGFFTDFPEVAGIICGSARVTDTMSRIRCAAGSQCAPRRKCGACWPGSCPRSKSTADD